MKTLAILAVLIVAALHIGFLVLEMFLWEQPMGRSMFSLTAEQASNTAVLAANQGLYNGFLAAGLLWGVIRGQRSFIFFFLLCVIIAGVYGAITVSPSILVVQAVPAIIALVLNMWPKKQ
jgi:putative membrane protein